MTTRAVYIMTPSTGLYFDGTNFSAPLANAKPFYIRFRTTASAGDTCEQTIEQAIDSLCRAFKLIWNAPIAVVLLSPSVLSGIPFNRA